MVRAGHDFGQKTTTAVWHNAADADRLVWALRLALLQSGIAVAPGRKRHLVFPRVGIGKPGTVQFTQSQRDVSRRCAVAVAGARSCIVRNSSLPGSKWRARARVIASRVYARIDVRPNSRRPDPTWRCAQGSSNSRGLVLGRNAIGKTFPPWARSALVAQYVLPERVRHGGLRLGVAAVARAAVGSQGVQAQGHDVDLARTERVVGDLQHIQGKPSPNGHPLCRNWTGAARATGRDSAGCALLQAERHWNRHRAVRGLGTRTGRCESASSLSGTMRSSSTKSGYRQKRARCHRTGLFATSSRLSTRLSRSNPPASWTIRARVRTVDAPRWRIDIRRSDLDAARAKSRLTGETANARGGAQNARAIPTSRAFLHPGSTWT